MTTVVGIGGSDHDVHACVVRDGEVVVAVEEERLSRRKYGLGGNLLEGLALRRCLEAAGIGLEQVDKVVVDAILAPTALATCRSRAVRVDHHLAHAAAAYFTSGFDAATVLVVDNAGQLVKVPGGEPGLQATSWYRAEGRQIDLVDRVTSRNWVDGPKFRGEVYQRGDGDDSLGHLYKKFTGALGFRFAAGDDGFYFPEDGITMGLAAYGDGRFVEELWALVELRPEGQYRIPLTDGRLDAMLGRWLRDADFEARAAVAAAAQEVLTRVLFHVIEHAVAATGSRRLCLSGGVAMNTVANGRILREMGLEALYVPPMPGDNGTGIGAALWAATRDPGAPVPRYSVYGGPKYGPASVDAALGELDPSRYSVERLDDATLLDRVAAAIEAGRVVAWFEGGSENGRRALGHRSLLADPRSVERRDHVNLKVKGRQWFRPLAPVVPEELASTYFDAPCPSPYMQIVCAVRPEHRAALAGVAHVDGTARLQTVRADAHPRLHALLHAFGRRTGVPVLINTSLNVAGEPMVESPRDAIRSLTTTAIDALVLEDRLVTPR